MSKKNKGKSAFYFFMLDWKKREEAKGKAFPEGLRDVQRDPKCSEEWQNLSSQEKGYYNKRASESKVEAQKCTKKKTTIGEYIEDIQEAERKEKEFHQNMLQYIESVVSMGVEHKSLEKLKFMFIHVNWFCRREIGINKCEYYPAEFAVAEFSLGKGVENIYHEIINMKIPLGWKLDALEISQRTHRIPIQLPEGQSDLVLMYEKLVKFLESNKTGNKFPPLFTLKDMVPAVDSLLIKMTDAAGESVDDFLIYSLEALFTKLRNTAVQNVDNGSSISIVIAENEFKKDIFSSTRYLECDFHKLIDGTSEYCSMSIVKRWGFTVCDYCCEFLNIPMIEGIHYPLSPAIDVGYQDQDQDQDSIDTRLKSLSLNSQRTVVELNGVTNEHRIKVSERSYAEELRRRAQVNNLHIICHGESNTSSNSAVLTGRPLRPPKTVSQAAATDENKHINCFNTSDFPPLGGKSKLSKKNVANMRLPLGRGRGST